jgi:hypothetical protein
MKISSAVIPFIKSASHFGGEIEGKREETDENRSAVG